MRRSSTFSWHGLSSMSLGGIHLRVVLKRLEIDFCNKPCSVLSSLNRTNGGEVDTLERDFVGIPKLTDLAIFLRRRPTLFSLSVIRASFTSPENRESDRRVRTIENSHHRSFIIDCRSHSKSTSSFYHILQPRFAICITEPSDRLDISDFTI